MASKFFVGGLLRETTNESLRAYFEMFGDVVESVVMQKDGFSRGFGFVTFANPVVTPTFLQSLHVVDGKQVEVKPAVPAEAMLLNSQIPSTRNFNTPLLSRQAFANKGQAFTVQSNKLFIGGISLLTTAEMLKAHFSKFGDVTDCSIMGDGMGRPRGFAFITYASVEGAANALQLGPHIIDGREVDVKAAEPKGSPFLTASILPKNKSYLSMPSLRGNSQYGAISQQLNKQIIIENTLQGSTENPHSLNAKVFVGGLQRETTEKSLLSYFSQFGALEGCEIMRRDGISRGFGFVVFKEDNKAQMVLMTPSHIIDGRQVECKSCVPKTDSVMAQLQPNIYGLRQNVNRFRPY